MSFTVDLILTELPEDQQQAWSYIEELREEYYDDKTGVHPKLKTLHDKLTLKYPYLCSYEDHDPEMDESPWADGPMIVNFSSKMGMIAIRFSHVDEVFYFILEAALALGIILANGQSEKIYRPW